MKQKTHTKNHIKSSVKQLQKYQSTLKRNVKKKTKKKATLPKHRVSNPTVYKTEFEKAHVLILTHFKKRIEKMPLLLADQ